MIENTEFWCSKLMEMWLSKIAEGLKKETALKIQKQNTGVDELARYLFQIRGENKMCIS